MSSIELKKASVVTQKECNQRSRRFTWGVIGSTAAIISTAGAFLFFGLTQCSDAVDAAHTAEKKAVEAVGELKTEHNATFHAIASQLGAHEAAQVETMRRIDGSLDDISDTLKEQNTEMREQRTMIQTIMRNGNN